MTYLQSLVAGAARVDLDGNPVGEVSAETAEHARERDLASREVGQTLVAASRAARTMKQPAATGVLPAPSVAKVAPK